MPTDTDSQFADPHIDLNYLKISVNPPYLKPLKTPKNDLGLPKKDYYMTGDVCKVLGVSPDTFRARIYRGFYPDPVRVGEKRRFTLDQIREIIRITNNLIRKGTFLTR